MKKHQRLSVICWCSFLSIEYRQQLQYQNNYIEDSRVLTLRQFFVFNVTYSLSKTGLNKAGSDGGMRVITR